MPFICIQAISQFELYFLITFAKVYNFISYYQIIMMNVFPGIKAYRRKRVFLNPNTINRHLHCCVCQDVFQDPVRTICGHTFCYICIQQWSSIKMHCPVCKQSIRARKLQKDLLAIAMVDDLQVKCAHFGCHWQGVQSVRKKHQRCCPFKPRNEQIPQSNQITLVDVTDLDQQNQDSEIQIISP